MTDEYTPTTNEVRDGYVHDPEAEYYDPEGYPFAVAGAKRAFDRWLAAHDREVRAKAWDEGHDAAVDIAWRAGRYVRVTSDPGAPNPYRGEATSG